MMEYIIVFSIFVWQEYGVWVVIYLYVGGSIEFVDEIEWLVNDILYYVVGLCLDIGYFYYVGMDLFDWLDCYYYCLDYLYFKDVDLQVYQCVIYEGIDFFIVCVEGVMCLFGSGVIDYLVIKDFFVCWGYQGWIIFE